MITNLYEIFNEFSKQTTRDTRKAILLKYESPHLKQFLIYAFNPNIQFYIKEFPKEYIQPDTLPGLRIAGIESELRKTYMFQIGNPIADKLTPQKRNTILLQLLESFEPNEAKLYIKMLQKNLDIPYLTTNLINEIFPNLLEK